MNRPSKLIVLALLLLAAPAFATAPEDNPAAQQTKIEYVPSTMPVAPGETPPPPKVTVTLPPPILVPAPPDFGDDKWTPGNVAKLLGYALVLVAVGWMALQVAKVKFGLQATAERVDRQGKTQEGILQREGTGSGGPPPVV